MLGVCHPLWTAPPVSDGLLLWLDATDPATLFQDAGLTTLAAPGTPVGGWFDKSGNDFHATQSDPFLLPVWDATAMNGHPALRFSGVDTDGMAIDDGLSLQRPYTVFIVNQYYTPNYRGRTLQGQDANWLHGLWGNNFASYADGFVGSRLAPINFPLVEDTVGADDGSTFFVNGLDFTTGPDFYGEPGRLGLVSVGVYPGEVSDADISEVLVYDRALDTEELDAMRSYLYTKYGVDDFSDDEQNVVLHGSIGLFTGGDPGEGLDMEGNFAYAINVGGAPGRVVGDAQFTDGSEVGMRNGTSPGATITDDNEIPVWGDRSSLAEYGDTPNDNNLEFLMRSIRWSDAPTSMDVNLQVQAGTPYRLQLLFDEQCCDRGFDIRVEGQLLVDNFNVQLTQGGAEINDQGALFSYDIVAPDSELNISLGGYNVLAPDNNPILNAVTLEIAPEGTLPGDFNTNGILDAADIDMLSAAVRAGANPPAYDLTSDNLVNEADRTRWVEVLKYTYFGDANLDGEFNSGDFVAAFAAGKYEDGVAGNAGWAEGDWDGNGDFESADFVRAFASGGYELGPRPAAAVAAVPEPGTALLLLLGLALWIVPVRHQRRW